MARSRTTTAPRGNQIRTRTPRPTSRRATLPPGFANRTPDGIYPAHRTELFPVAMASVVLGFLAFLVCAKNGWLLLYGDAVAHMGIARRILDARYPGLGQLGGVWLPLPHLLMVPFVQRMDWWQNGFAGALPSILSYIAGNLGMYRLARRLMPTAWAFVAATFVALNPNLLYLATTAMTEPLFLALLVWSTVMTMEAVDALRERKTHTASMRMLAVSGLVFAMVLTRYDGWIAGAAIWCMLAWAWFRSEAETRRQTTAAFAGSTAIIVAGPLLWFGYNAKYEGDWLDFMRGPYSASAILRKTSPPSAGKYHGWHNPLYAFLYYTRAAQLDAAAFETGFSLFAGSIAGTWLLWRTRTNRVALLLWMPLPFYMYSIAWGSVPIFLPQVYPHAWYNSRYGMELLPAFALFGTLAMAGLWAWLRQTGTRKQAAGNSLPGAKKPTRLWLADALVPASLLAIVANTVLMFGTAGTVLRAMHQHPWTWVGRPPLVFDEAVVNSRTRIPFEQELAAEMERAGPNAVILFNTNDHIGAVQDAGIPLKRLVSPLDSQAFDAARKDPAGHASLVIALDNKQDPDPVFEAVKAHPEGLSEIEILCHTGQPCARIYRSDRFKGNQ